jgi:hypothetical protein
MQKPSPLGFGLGLRAASQPLHASLVWECGEIARIDGAGGGANDEISTTPAATIARNMPT